VSASIDITVTYKPIRKYECTNRMTGSKIRGIKIEFYAGNKPATCRSYVVCDTHKSTLDCKTWSGVIAKARKPWEWCEKCNGIRKV
jgi:hypothetical protein